MSANQYYEGDRGVPQEGYQQDPTMNNQQYAPPAGYPQQPFQQQYPQPPKQEYQPSQSQYQAPQNGPNSYGMTPSAPYAAPSQPPPNNGAAEYQGSKYQDTAPFSQANEKTGARFAPRKRLNDPIFLILFIAAVAGFAVVSGIAIDGFIQVNGLGGGFGSIGTGQTGNSVTLD